MRLPHRVLWHLTLASASVLAAAATPAIGAPSTCRTVTADDGVPAFGTPLTSPFPNLDPLQVLRADMDLLDLPPGGDGAGVNVADLEYDWDAGHVELSRRSLGGPKVPPPLAYSSIAHGTATLTLIGADADQQGVSGIAPAATLMPRSTMTAGRAWDPAAAIRSAAAELRPGDVMLLEQQGVAVLPQGNTSQSFYVPVYATAGPTGAAVHAALTDAVAAGIVVVVPAGNGDNLNGVDLANTGVSAPNGVIVVGAGQTLAAGGVTGARASFSNYGADVDVQGPGMGVVAGDAYPRLSGTSFGTQEANLHSSYTHCFSGTSSASAVTAAGIAVMQGIARAGRGTPFTPAEVEARLAATGLDQPRPSDGRIGPLAQYRAAADLVPPAAATNLASSPAVPTPGQPVTLTWTSPADAAKGSGRVDDVVLVDGNVVGRVTPGRGELVVTAPPRDGATHRWSVRAADKVGNASVAEAAFGQPAVEEPPPSTGTANPSATQPLPQPVGPTPVTPVVTPVGPPQTPTVKVTTAPQFPAASLLGVSRVSRGSWRDVRFRLAKGATLAVRGRAATVRGAVVRVAVRPARSIIVTARGGGAQTVTYALTVTRSGVVTSKRRVSSNSRVR